MESQLESITSVQVANKHWLKIQAENTQKTTKLSMVDNQILQEQQLPCMAKKEQSVKLVIWCKPQIGWVKLNVYRSCRRNPRNSGGGGLIYDEVGKMHGAFSLLLGHETNNETKMRALKEGVVLCMEMGFS